MFSLYKLTCGLVAGSGVSLWQHGVEAMLITLQSTQQHPNKWEKYKSGIYSLVTMGTGVGIAILGIDAMLNETAREVYRYRYP
jgi:hypothetical protein